MGISAVALIPVGLILRFLPLGLFADLAGGVLYAALIYVLVAFLLPRTTGLTLGFIALSWCVGVELLQLSDAPQTMAQSFPLSKLVFGSSFSWLDLAAYVAGTALTWLVDRRFRRTE